MGDGNPYFYLEFDTRDMQQLDETAEKFVRNVSK